MTLGVFLRVLDRQEVVLSERSPDVVSPDKNRVQAALQADGVLDAVEDGVADEGMLTSLGRIQRPGSGWAGSHSTSMENLQERGRGDAASEGVGSA